MKREIDYELARNIRRLGGLDIEGGGQVGHAGQSRRAGGQSKAAGQMGRKFASDNKKRRHQGGGEVPPFPVRPAPGRRRGAFRKLSGSGDPYVRSRASGRRREARYRSRCIREEERCIRFRCYGRWP